MHTLARPSHRTRGTSTRSLMHSCQISYGMHCRLHCTLVIDVLLESVKLANAADNNQKRILLRHERKKWLAWSAIKAAEQHCKRKMHTENQATS